MISRIGIHVFLFLIISGSCTHAQNVSQKIAEAFTRFMKDSQMSNASVSLYVIDAKNDQVVFDRNSALGLAPASTQKIITSTAAYELLGNDFRYRTRFSYEGTIKNGNLDGDICITGSGDPTLGSWRWKETNERDVVSGIVTAIQRSGIRSLHQIVLDSTGWQDEKIPDGWIWQDAGNYYGAGAQKLNWRENQYELILASGDQIGDSVKITGAMPALRGYHFVSYATAAAKGSGDNSYIYLPLNSKEIRVRGTIPVGEHHFAISGSMPWAGDQFIQTLADSMAKRNITIESSMQRDALIPNKFNKNEFYLIQSPVMDSMMYWFLQKSINLYGEALIKTIAAENNLEATTEHGVQLVKGFWKQKNIPENELNIIDGSGLSPLNRVTTHAQVSILNYAKSRSWFRGFYNALPVYNGIKMKSGTISGVKGFCGYHTSKAGTEYIFSFLVNNYNGSSSGLVKKMYQVLNELK